MKVWPDKMAFLTLGADMARPSRTGGKTSAAKTRKASSVKGRNPAKTKRRIALTAVRLNRPTVSGLGKELEEAREQQAATGEILKVIANSPDDVQPVFEAIVANAARLIEGFTTAVFRFIDGDVHLAAITSIAGDETVRASFPRPIGGLFAAPQAGDVLAIADTEKYSDALLRRLARAHGGFRSVLYVPLKSSTTSTGAIAVGRKAPGAFAAHHVKLLQTFAAQAVIAIENVQLFDALQARTRDLEESLQQQTATAAVLKVISHSAFDVQTVLETLVDSAAQLCEAESAQIFRRSNTTYKLAACRGYSREYEEHMKLRQFEPGHPAFEDRGKGSPAF